MCCLTSTERWVIYTVTVFSTLDSDFLFLSLPFSLFLSLNSFLSMGPLLLVDKFSYFLVPFPESIKCWVPNFLFHASYHLCSPSLSFLFGHVFFFKCVAFGTVID